MEAFFDRIGRMEIASKLGILLAVLVALTAAYFFGFYKDIKDQRDRLEGAISSETKKKNEAKAAYDEFVKLKKQVDRMKKLDQFMVKSLPDEADIPLGELHKRAEAAGVQVISVSRREEEQTRVYARIPINLEIVGAYHKIMEFFWKLGQMDRIVKISNIKMTNPRVKEGQMLVSVTCEAATFRYLSGRRSKTARK